jgi:hypothetical protein
MIRLFFGKPIQVVEEGNYFERQLIELVGPQEYVKQAEFGGLHVPMIAPPIEALDAITTICSS